MNNPSGASSGSREPSPKGLGPSGFDPSERAKYRWVALAKNNERGSPWNYYILDLDGNEMALCQMPDAELHAEQIVDALNQDDDKFNLRWNADMRAIKRWQAANPGNDLVWPDRADLVVWLLEQLDSAKRAATPEGTPPC